MTLPEQVKSTETFMVELYDDILLTSKIAETLTGLTIDETLMSPGAIDIISLTADTSTTIQDRTTYTIEFLPDNPIYADSEIQITFGSNINLDSTSCTLTSDTLDVSATCVIVGSIVTISNPFDTTYVGGLDGAANIIVTIDGGNNPDAEMDAGDFTVQTFNYVAGLPYVVDEGTASNLFTPDRGVIFPNTDSSGTDTGLVTETFITGDTNVLYEWHFDISHDVPVGGFIVI